MKIGIASLLLLVATCGQAFAASNDGSFASHGSTMSMKAVFAEKTKDATFIVFTDKPDVVQLEPKKFGNRDYLADFRCNLIAHGGKVATLIISSGMDFALSTYDADCKLALHVSGHPMLNLDEMNDARIAGWVKAADPKSGTDVNLSFAQPLHGGLHNLTPEENKILDDAMPSPNDMPPPPPPPPPPPEPPAPPKKHR